MSRRALRTGFAFLLILLAASALSAAQQYVFRTNPPVSGATVYVDGASAGETDENGKLVITRVGPGVHLLRVESGGESYAAEVTFDAELNSLPAFKLDTPLRAPKPATPGVVDYTIDTNLADADVSVDGNAPVLTDNAGRAVVRLSVGQAHRIEVRKSGYQPHSETVTPVKAGQLNVVLESPAKPGRGVDGFLIVLVVLLVASIALLSAIMIRRRTPRPAMPVVATARADVLPEQNAAHFDRYRLLGALGSGGVATIYRAHDLIDKTSVALKVLDARWLSDPDMVRKFLSEGEALQAIKQRDPAAAVVTCFRFGREHDSIVGRPFIALELLEGETLQERLDRESMLPPATAVAVAYQIGSALVAVHGAAIVHRDLTPDNIFLTKADFVLRGERYAVPSVVLIDFGIARRELLSRATMDGSIAGKPHYMSPEQCRGAAVDARSDLYSLGIILYQMAAGRLPFSGRDPFEVMRAQMSDEPPALGTQVPDKYAELCRQLLRKQPEARPQSAVLIDHELEQVLLSMASQTSPNVLSFPKRRISQ